jgi:hypothetical protein
MRNRLSILGIGLFLAMYMASFGLAGSGPAAVRATTTLEVCGKVTAYVAATAKLPGTVTVGGDPFVIAAGADVDAELDAGADACLNLTINSAGAVTELVVVDAQANATLRVCGVISVYVRATASQTGRISIGERDLVIAAGADLPASVKVGADVCATLALNARGQVEDGEVRVRADSTIHLCGTVNAVTKATADSTGLLQIGNHDLKIAAGTDLATKVKVGANICADLTLNVRGEIVDCDVVPSTPGGEPTPTNKPDGPTKPDATNPPDGPNKPDGPSKPDQPAGPGGSDGTDGPGGETCPDGTISAGGGLSTVLNADASLAERTGALAATGAIPVGMFVLGMLAAGIASRWRRPKTGEASPDDASAE